MFYIYFSISCLLSFVFLSRTWRFFWRIIPSVVVWAVGAGILYLIIPGAVVLGEDGPHSLETDSALFLSMLLGMSAKYMWDQIEIRKERNSRRAMGEPKIGLEFDFWDFVKPMLVSVLVFEYATGLKHELTRIALIGSFQNGFFWQTLFNKLGHIPAQTGKGASEHPTEIAVDANS